VGQRLLDAGHDPRHVGQRLADSLQRLLAAAGAVRSRVAMNSEALTGTACSSSSARPFGARRLNIRQLLQALLDRLGDALRSCQRGAGRQDHVDLHGAFVEGRQKVALQPQQADDADADRRQSRDQDEGRHAQTEPDGTTRQILEAAQQQPIRSRSEMRSARSSPPKARARRQGNDRVNPERLSDQRAAAASRPHHVRQPARPVVHRKDR